tara:strand:- start:760 stop:1260 length:501 start_codon:yes stop_codon:yes gene_type:complete
MAEGEINEYLVTATEILDGSFVDIDQLIDPNVWESQKVPKSVLLKELSTAPIQFYASDLATDLTVSTLLVEIPLPYDFVATEVRANVLEAPTGAKLICNIKTNGFSILSTLLSIDDGEKTSLTASVPAQINFPTLENDKILTVEVTQVGSTIAGKGLFITINGYKL